MAPSALHHPPPRAPPFCLLLHTLSEPPSAGPGAWHRPRPPPPGPATAPLRSRPPPAAVPAAQGRPGRAENAGPSPAARSGDGALARPTCGLLGACAAACCGQGKARAGPGGGARSRAAYRAGDGRRRSARRGFSQRDWAERGGGCGGAGGRAGGEGGAELGAEWKRPSSPGRARRQHVTSLPERDPGKGGRERVAAAARRLGPAARRGRGLCLVRRGKGWRRRRWRQRRREGEARRGGARLSAAPPAAASAAARPPSAARGSACSPGAERRSRGPLPGPAPPYWSLPRPKAAIPRCRPAARPGLVVMLPGGPRSASGLTEASRSADLGGFRGAEMEKRVLGDLTVGN